MGFQEMPTNNYVESSFWNFDSLFQPQQHPARDAHDTFFLTNPETSDNFPEDYLQRVKVSLDKALWIACYHPLTSWACCDMWLELLQQTPLLYTDDMRQASVESTTRA